MAFLRKKQPTTTATDSSSNTTNIMLNNTATIHDANFNTPTSDAKRIQETLLATVRNHEDVIALAAPDHPGFQQAHFDESADISMFTMPVEGFPINMMKARAVFPCSPRDFFRYLELGTRQRWDEHYSAGNIISRVDEMSYFKYMSFKSVMPPLLSARDFEMCVCERFYPDGSAVLKAISTPPGYLVGHRKRPPPQPEKGRTVTAVPGVKGSVRGHIAVSGFVVKPILSEKEEKEEEKKETTTAGGGGGKDTDSTTSAASSTARSCEVTYIALAHPMGLVPASLVNLVIGKQTSTLKELQAYMRANPLPPATPEEIRRHDTMEWRGNADGSTTMTTAPKNMRRSKL